MRRLSHIYFLPLSHPKPASKIERETLINGLRPLLLRRHSLTHGGTHTCLCLKFLLGADILTTANLFLTTDRTEKWRQIFFGFLIFSNLFGHTFYLRDEFFAHAQWTESREVALRA